MSFARLLLANLRKPFAAASVLLIVAVAASDSVTQTWAAHPMLTNIVSSLLMVLLGAVVIGAALQASEELRWRRVANICLKALAQEVVIVRDSLVYFFRGRLPYPEEHPWHRFGAEMSPHVEGLAADAPMEKSLETLLQRDGWVMCTYGLLLELSETTRQSLGDWAPVMVESSRLCDAVSRVGHLADAIEDLHRPLGPLHRHGCGIEEADRRRLTIAVFERTLTFSVALEEWLWATMGRRTSQGPWKTRGRELLTEAGKASLDQIDRKSQCLHDLESELRCRRDELRDQYPSAYQTAASLD